MDLAVGSARVWGTLARIDARTGKTRVLWRKENSSVQYVAAGAGGVWALIGSAGTTRIARFTLAGRLNRIWDVPDAGRMAADVSGCWISTAQWLVHIDPKGDIHHVVQARLGDIATGAGAVWLPQPATVLRVDERTDQIRTFQTGRLRLGGFQHDLAVGGGALWTLNDAGRFRTTLERFDLRDGRRTGRVDVPGIADGVIVEPGAVWVATVIAPANRPATGYDVIRLDPHTLRRTLLVRVD